MRWSVVMGLTLVAAMVATGCGRPAPKQATPGPDQAVPAKPVVVGIVSPALTSTFHTTLIAGAKDEGGKLGWTVDSIAPDRETNFAAQVNLIEALVQRKVNAISICAINDTAIVGAIEKANAVTIPVFVHNSLSQLQGAQVKSYIGYDQRKAGLLCGQYACELLKKKYGDYKGQVYVLLGIPGVHSQERSGGFVEAVQAHPAIEVVAQTPANWERQQAMNLALAALKATPALDGFFGCSDAMAQGAAQAGREAEREVFTIGIDGNPDTLEDIKNGVVTASCAVFPEEMGRITIRTIQQVLDGKPADQRVETPIKIIDQSNVDELLGKGKTVK